MADACIECDVAIVGSGFAGALIANELGKRGKKVVILEAGAGVPPNINEYLERFYTASAKVPEVPYTPVLFEGANLRDPGIVAAGRPTVLTLSEPSWKNAGQSYLIQEGPMPFASTYDRVAGGTSHWLGTCLRLVPKDFTMKTSYGLFEDWPIKYDDLNKWYGDAERELGVSAELEDQKYCGVEFLPDYKYPMPEIPKSLIDQRIESVLKKVPDSETSFLGMAAPVTEIKVRGLPAARNSQPYRNRRACAGNTNCIPICPIQAKYDPTITLNDAMNTGFVTMMPRTVASEIITDKTKQADGTTNVTQINFIQYGDNDKGPKTDSGCVKAKVYVIAANAIETPRLLLMSKNDGRTAKGVANRSDMVGRNLMDHPYYVAWGILPEAQPVFPYRGPLITAGIGDLCDGPFRATRGAFRMDIGNEGWNFVVAGGQFGGDPNVTTVDFVNGTNASGLNSREPNGPGKGREALFGVDLARKLNDVISRQFRVGFLVEQTPDRDNQVTLSDVTDGLGLPRAKIKYNLSDYTRKGIVAAYKMKNLLFKQLGVEAGNDFTMVRQDDPARFEEQIDGKTVALTYTGAGHIMGTCRMGDDPNTSVVDSFQCSHDHKNLYLAGSGVFPTGGTANPTLTIAALSLRTADHLINKILK